jgi:hypothetical protein
MHLVLPLKLGVTDGQDGRYDGPEKEEAKKK